jgi:hypothetical protein
MPAFGTASLTQLDTCRTEIVETLELVVAEYDITVLEGVRSWARQADLLRRGKTKVGPGGSDHNPPKLADGTEDPNWLSNAVDCAPYPIDWRDARRFIYMAGLVIGTGRALGYDFGWGGNWDEDQIILDDQNFDDLPHFWYKGPLTATA